MSQGEPKQLLKQAFNWLWDSQCDVIVDSWILGILPILLMADILSIFLLYCNHYQYDSILLKVFKFSL